MRAALSLLFVAVGSVAAPAAVVCVQNRTAAEVTFAVTHKPDGRQVVTLAPGDTAAVPVGREPTLIVTRGQENERYRLDPYTPYVFIPKGESFDFQGAKLSGELPKPDDVPAAPAARKPFLVPVTLLVNDGDGRARAVWEKAVRDRFAAAAKPFESQVGVRFDVAVTAEWKAAGGDWDAVLDQFREAVAPKPGGLAVGFLSRPPAKDDGRIAAVGRPWRAHLLLRGGWPKTEAERVDVLAHALARHLGAVVTADPVSVLREKLLDGQATKPAYRIRFDPLNLLVMHVWAEEKAAGHGLTWEALRPKARARLLVLYKTLAELPSRDALATAYIEALVDEKEPVAPPPVPADPARKLSDREAAIYAVVRAVTETARSLADDPKRPRNDALTVEYVRAAAAAAYHQADDHRAAAFLIGLGLALDDSTILRTNPLTRDMCARIEDDAERKDRLAVLGTPTVRGRRDLCQHFVVSVALVQLVGTQAAEFAGLSKELSDMKGASGFSFVDLSADYAGVAFAKEVAADPPRLGKLRADFTVSDWVPAFDGLREGLPEAKFKADFGGPSDERFKKVVADIRKRVAALPAHKK